MAEIGANNRFANSYVKGGGQEEKYTTHSTTKVSYLNLSQKDTKT